jgi:hypothetical protein
VNLVTRRVIAAVAAVVAAPALVYFSSGASANATPSIGAYTGSGSGGVTEHKAFASWSGGSIPYALEFATAASGWAGMENPTWTFNPWKATNYHLVYSLQMFPTSLGNSIGGSAALAQCAAGSYNSHWQTLAKNLVSNKLASTIVRPGWEMNGDWFDWQAGGHEASYISCFRQIVSTMRAVSGQHLQFNWNPASGETSSAGTAAYPGDAYVDQVGMDMYDWIWKKGLYDTKASQSSAQRLASQQAAWNIKANGTYGLRYWTNFAKSHGKPMTLPEWGLSNRVADNNGGGDDPYFIQQMFNFVYTPSNNVLFANYFNFKSPDGEHRIYGSSAFPKAAALFRQLVQHPPGSGSGTSGGGTGSPTPSVPPTTPPPPTTTAKALLMQSAGPTRGNATALSGKTEHDRMFVWAKVPAGTKKVEFRIDDPSASRAAKRTELDQPFDLGGSSGSHVHGYSITNLKAGKHTLSARVYAPDTTFIVSATFYVK